MAQDTPRCWLPFYHCTKSIPSAKKREKRINTRSGNSWEHIYRKNVNAVQATWVCRDPEMTNFMAIFNPNPIDLEECHQHHFVPSCLNKSILYPQNTATLTGWQQDYQDASCCTALNTWDSFQITTSNGVSSISISLTICNVEPHSCSTSNDISIVKTVTTADVISVILL